MSCNSGPENISGIYLKSRIITGWTGLSVFGAALFFRSLVVSKGEKKIINFVWHSFHKGFTFTHFGAKVRRDCCDGKLNRFVENIKQAADRRRKIISWLLILRPHMIVDHQQKLEKSLGFKFRPKETGSYDDGWAYTKQWSLQLMPNCLVVILPNTNNISQASCSLCSRRLPYQRPWDDHENKSNQKN